MRITFHTPRLALAFAFLAVSAAFASAHAAPGAPQSLSGPSVRGGVFELEARNSLQTGGDEDALWASDLEVGYGLSDWFSARASFRFRGGPERDDELAGVKLKTKIAFTRTHDWPVRFGLAIEALDDLHGGPVEIAARVLAEHRSGPLRLRANFDSSRAMQDGARWEFAYRAGAIYELTEIYDVALMGFGDLGDSDDFGAGGQEHYWGPALFVEWDRRDQGAVSAEFGYLVGFGEAGSDGIFRFAISLAR